MHILVPGRLNYSEPMGECRKGNALVLLLLLLVVVVIVVVLVIERAVVVVAVTMGTQKSGISCHCVSRGQLNPTARLKSQPYDSVISNCHHQP
jgi:hypothetical protein